MSNAKNWAANHPERIRYHSRVSQGKITTEQRRNRSLINYKNEGDKT